MSIAAGRKADDAQYDVQQRPARLRALQQEDLVVVIQSQLWVHIGSARDEIPACLNPQMNQGAIKEQRGMEWGESLDGEKPSQVVHRLDIEASRYLVVVRL